MQPRRSHRGSEEEEELVCVCFSQVTKRGAGGQEGGKGGRAGAGLLLRWASRAENAYRGKSGVL